MKWVVLATDEQRKELGDESFRAVEEIIWIEDPEQLSGIRADGYVDLQFTAEPERIKRLKGLLPSVIIVNSVAHTLGDVDTQFIRFGGWNTFLCTPLIEASGREEHRKKAEAFFDCFNKEVLWLPDDPGFVTPRVISMIINEAFISLGEGVSTREDIDTAMKLGTNYPYGPFEWAEKIGTGKVRELLEAMAHKNKKYQPSANLK